MKLKYFYFYGLARRVSDKKTAERERKQSRNSEETKKIRLKIVLIAKYHLL